MNKVTRSITIETKVILEIDLDKMDYGVHGGKTDPDEIAEEAVAYYVQEMDYTFQGIDGIDVLNSNVIQYQNS